MCKSTTTSQVLHHHRRRFAVCYPLLVEESQAEGKYNYVWHTQVRMSSEIPCASLLARMKSFRLRANAATFGTTRCVDLASN